MTIRVNIDGWPHRVTFTGGVDIERMWDGETVAVRGEGVKVELDWKELERQRERITEVRRAEARWRDAIEGYWRKIL